MFAMDRDSGRAPYVEERARFCRQLVTIAAVVAGELALPATAQARLRAEGRLALTDSRKSGSIPRRDATDQRRGQAARAFLFATADAQAVDNPAFWDRLETVVYRSVSLVHARETPVVNPPDGASAQSKHRGELEMHGNKRVFPPGHEGPAASQHSTARQLNRNGEFKKQYDGITD